jgi:hypothetical protein
MARRPLPSLLAFVAFVADLSGAHGFALAVLLAAIPAAFVLALDCYGDLLHDRCGLVRPVVSGTALVLLVFSAALRSPAVVGGVPRIAVSAIVFSLILYASLAASVVIVALRRAEAAVARADESVAPERLAA